MIYDLLLDVVVYKCLKGHGRTLKFLNKFWYILDIQKHIYSKKGIREVLE